MKVARILLLAVGATCFALASAAAYGWISEMAYTEVRQDSYERANGALVSFEPNPNRHLIRPDANDPGFYD